MSKQGLKTKRAVTLQDIAEQCGVSRVTVCRALKPEHPCVSVAVTEQVRAVAQKLGYDPEQQSVARRLALSRTGLPVLNRVIGLFTTTNLGASRFHADIFHGIVTQAARQGYGLMTVNTEEFRTPTPVPPSFYRGEVDGIIMNGPSWNNAESLHTLRTSAGYGARPIVLMHEQMRPGFSSVRTDRRGGARKATRHLLELGHRHIACIERPETQVKDGIRDALCDAGLDPTVYLHMLSMPEMFRRYAFTANYLQSLRTRKHLDWSDCRELLELLRRERDITAIITPNDPSAILLHYALTEIAGLRVPDDISLIGFDGTDPLYNQDEVNILTTVQLPLQSLGEQAIELLIQRITGEITEDTEVVLPTELMIRQTTAPPPPHGR